MAHVEADADRFAAFEVELRGFGEPRTQRACLRYGQWKGSMERHPPACAEWVADGRAQTLRLPLRGLAGWQGRIAHIRLEPFGRDAVPIGTRVSTRNPRLSPAPAARPPGGTP
jgi:hypothetical protein